MATIDPHVNGWTAVPRSIDSFLGGVDVSKTKPFVVSDIPIPSSKVAQQTQAYAKEFLSEPTFNHSMRVFYYGMTLLQNHKPSGLAASPGLAETYFLACMLHDIGTVPMHIKSTRMSFELWGAIHALQILPGFGASEDQAELVAEVVNRHQDLGETGTAPAILGLIYFATIFDNVGLNPEYVSTETIESVTAAYPRKKWSGCFAATIREETGLKPWSHTTVIDNFAGQVEGNKLMEPYDFVTLQPLELSIKIRTRHQLLFLLAAHLQSPAEPRNLERTTPEGNKPNLNPAISKVQFLLPVASHCPGYITFLSTTSTPSPPAFIQNSWASTHALRSLLRSPAALSIGIRSLTSEISQNGDPSLESIKGLAQTPPYPLSPADQARRRFPEPSAPPPPVPSSKPSDPKALSKDQDDEEEDWEKDDPDEDDDWEIADKPDMVPPSLKAGKPSTPAPLQDNKQQLPPSLKAGPLPGVIARKSQESFQAAGVSQVSLPMSSTYASSISLNRDGTSLQSQNPFLKHQNTGQSSFGYENSAAIWGDVPASAKYGDDLPPVELPAVHSPSKEFSKMNFGEPSQPAARPPPVPFVSEKEAVLNNPMRSASGGSSGWEPGMDISHLDAGSSRGHGLPAHTDMGPSRTWQEQQTRDGEERERRQLEAAAAAERAQKAEQSRKAEEEWHLGEAARNAAYQTPEDRGPNLPPRRPSEGPQSQMQPSGAHASSSEQPRPLPPRPSAPEHYSIKQVRWYDVNCSKVRLSPILTQNVNGPCPLLALANALILSTPEELSGSTGLTETLRTREQVSLGLLLDAVFDELMSGRRGDAAQELPDVSELYNFLMTLHTGMNVNPRFTFVPDRASREIHPAMRPTTALGGFEETKEMTLYSTFDVPLVHGWLPPRNSPAYAAFFRNAKTYEDAQNIQFHEEELEDKLDTDGLTPQEQQLFEDLHTIKDFLHSWPTQLTDYGLQTLQEHLKPGSFSILFRNDHFSTVYKEPKAHQVLTLVTDAGYATHDEIVWESLVDVSGQSSELFSGDFRPVSHSPLPPPPGPSVGPRGSSLGGPRPGNSMLDVGNESQWTTVQRGRGNGLNQHSQETGITGSSSLLPTHDTSSDDPAETSKSIQEDHDLALALQLQEEEEAQARRDNEARQREQRLSNQVLDGQGRFNPPGGRIPNSRVNIPITTTQSPRPQSQQAQQGLRPIIPPRRNREDEEVPPPTYEQAASHPEFVPPTNHPASPSAPLPGTDSGTGRRRESAPTPGYGRGGPMPGRGRGQGIQPGQGRPPGAPVGTEDRERCVVM